MSAAETDDVRRIGPEPGDDSPFGTAFFTASPLAPDAERGVLTGTVNRHEENRHGRMRVRGKTIEILLPSSFDADRRYRVVYLLSACGRLDREALDIVRERGLHDAHDVICVLPEMGGWYGDHPSDTTRRSQSYLRDVIVPLVEEGYPTVPGKEGRLLLGFSKSGWGALSILLCNPDSFGYAASWDAPLMFEDAKFKRWGKGLGTLGNWRFHHPRDAAERNAEHFRDRARIVHYEGRAWSKHAAPYHAHLEALGIPHVFSSDHRPKHRWDAEWVEPAFTALIELADAPAGE